jgi:hypothetical protein
LPSREIAVPASAAATAEPANKAREEGRRTKLSTSL